MKKFILSLMVIGTCGFASCDDDDDDDASGSNECQTCATTVGELTTELEYCDNGDGTFNTYIAGQLAGENVTLNGQSFSTFMDAVNASPTTTCN